MATITRVPMSVQRHFPLPVMNSHPMKKSLWLMPVGVKSLMLVIAPQDSVDKCLIPFASGAEPCQHVFVEPQGNLLFRLRKLYRHGVFPGRGGQGGFRISMTAPHRLVLAHMPVCLAFATLALSLKLFRRIMHDML